MNPTYTDKDQRLLYSLARSLYGAGGIPQALSAARGPWPIKSRFTGTLPGPLPLTFSFTTTLGQTAAVLFILSGTGYDTVGTRLDTYSYQIDALAAVNFSCYVNPASVHATVPPQVFLASLPRGSHTLKVSVVSNAASDLSDRWTLAVLELPQ